MNEPRRSLTIGGLPGTGTTTLSRLLGARLALPYIYAGQVFREEAQRRGLDLAAFGRLCETDPSVDLGLDARQVELLRTGGLLLEGRLSGWLAFREGLPALKVWVVCDEGERIRRLVARDGGTAAQQAARTAEREASEADRYRRYHGIDVADLTPYDLVMDSTRRTPEGLADEVEAAWRRTGHALDARRGTPTS